MNGFVGNGSQGLKKFREVVVIYIFCKYCIDNNLKSKELKNQDNCKM